MNNNESLSTLTAAGGETKMKSWSANAEINIHLRISQKVSFEFFSVLKIFILKRNIQLITGLSQAFIKIDKLYCFFIFDVNSWEIETRKLTCDYQSYATGSGTVLITYSKPSLPIFKYFKSTFDWKPPTKPSTDWTQLPLRPTWSFLFRRLLKRDWWIE